MPEKTAKRVIWLLLGATLSARPPSVFAQTPPAFTTLYDFHGGSDGAWPSGVVIGEGGVLYGTTWNGGRGQCGPVTAPPQQCGTVFSLTPPATVGGSWTESILYSFAGGADGAQPLAGVVIGPDGALYGTTYRGGTGKCNQVVSGCGTVFKLTPPSTTGGPWTETILYRFTDADDGANPGALIFHDGKLYGTASGGSGGYGTVFQLTPRDPPGAEWTLTTLYSFPGGKDGGLPITVTMGKNGALYGTAGSGGDLTCFTGGPDPGCGTVFELSPGERGWKQTVLYRFPGDIGGGYRGASPTAGVVIGSDGTLYGPTSGYIFGLTPSVAAGGAWTESTLYDFPCRTCEWYPLNAPLTIAADGTLDGTTVGGGLPGCDYIVHCGTVFALTPPAQPGGAWTATNLHAFKRPGSGEGSNPEAGVAVGSGGVLYGTTLYGGSGVCDDSGLPYGCGTVFQVTP